MKKEVSLSLEHGDANQEFDDDGKIKRTGTTMVASAHIITAVIGSGVLTLTWCFAQLGWIAGIVLLTSFGGITLFNCLLLTDCYRSPDPVTGARNYTYMQAVKVNLGGLKYMFCGLAQYGTQVGSVIGYTITAAISMAAIKKAHCYHNYGKEKDCHTSNNWYIIIFGLTEVVLSQVPNFHRLTIISIIAAIMSFTYALIGIILSLIQIAGGAHPKTSLTGIPIGPNMSRMDKMWNSLNALGNIAFAYSFAIVLLEIQDTLKSSPPENKVMKKASTIGISASTLFYLLCAIVGYAAFGHDAPGNYLTGFGFFEPYWLIDIGNLAIVIHLLGAYQVFIQPFFGFVENWSRKKWPESSFITQEYYIGNYSCNLFRLTWRSIFVLLATLIAMIFPFFNSFLGLIGAFTFWPLTVYFPIEMYISRAKIRTFSCKWNMLQTLSLMCLMVTILSAAGSVRGLIVNVRSFKLFHSVS